MFELTKSDVVLIHVIANFRELFPIMGISLPNFCDRFNVPSNDASTTEQLKTSLRRLIKRKILFCKHQHVSLNDLTDEDFKTSNICVGLTKRGGKVWEAIFEVNLDNCWMNKSFDYNHENNSVLEIYIFFNSNHLNKFKKFVINTSYLELIDVKEDEKNTFPIWDKQKAKEAYLCGVLINQFNKHAEMYNEMPKPDWIKNINQVLGQWN